MASELSSEDRAEFVVEAEAIIKRIEDQKKRAA
jgi:hypothetical protein